MLIENELENFVVSINGQKVCATGNNIDQFALQMPAEAASLLTALKSQGSSKDSRDPDKFYPITMNSENLLAELQAQTSIIKIHPDNEGISSNQKNLSLEAANLLASIKNKEIVKKNVSITSPDLKKIIDETAKQETSLVRAMPEMLQAVIDKRSVLEKLCSETDPVKKLIIHESGIALGIVVGKTTRQEAVEIMKNNSTSVPDENEPLYFYSDISLSIFFDDSNVVSELKFGNKYKGQTSKGLSIGDSVDMAIEMYGSPKLKSPKGAIWDKFAIFCEKNIITSIRIQK